MNLNEAKQILEKNGFVTEAAEPGYLRGEISDWDRININRGRKPIWAKKITDIGPRPTPIRGSSSASEVAMRSVTTSDGKERHPYTEGEWRRANDIAKGLNQNLADAIREGLEEDDFDEIEVNKDYVSVFVSSSDGQLDEFRIYPEGPRYLVKFVGHKSVFDKKNTVCKTLSDIIKIIKGE